MPRCFAVCHHRTPPPPLTPPSPNGSPTLPLIEIQTLWALARKAPWWVVREVGGNQSDVPELGKGQAPVFWSPVQCTGVRTLQSSR